MAKDWDLQMTTETQNSQCASDSEIKISYKTQPLRALIVEDEAEFTLAVEQAILDISERCAIRSFTQGTDAIFFIENNKSKINIALIDLGLPDIAGLEVIKHIRKWNPKTPILVITARCSRETLIDALLAGATGYLLKDESISDISQNIQHSLRGHMPISPQLTRFLTETILTREKVNEELSKILSRRELQLLRHLASGLTFHQCAHEMNLQLSTVHAYSKSLYRKLGIQSKSQAILVANKAGI